jgi:hypothetical protein
VFVKRAHGFGIAHFTGAGVAATIGVEAAAATVDGSDIPMTNAELSARSRM